MGELKELREEQTSLVERYKDLNRKAWLATLGAIGRIEDEANKQLDKYVAAGESAFGEEAADKNKYLLAARGLAETLKNIEVKDEAEKLKQKREELLDKYIDLGTEQLGEKAEKANKYVVAGFGAVAFAKEEAQKLFDELVAAGEQRAA